MPEKGSEGSEGSEIDMAGRENIILELHPLASDRPVETRLRWVLKHLLRQQQFRCVRISSGGDIPGDTDSVKPTKTPVNQANATDAASVGVEIERKERLQVNTG
jgi:hypothetical protein